MVKRRICPNGHGITVIDRQKFCRICGAKIVEVEVPGCSKCDYAWIDGDRFCPYCGAERKC